MKEEALLQYQNLESYLTPEFNNSRPKFEKFMSNDIGDDSASVLDWQKKPYRDMIYQNSISEFDFRQYLFARQAKVC